MDIYFDGLIYTLQNTGGISRYFTNLINELAENSINQLNLVLPNPPQIKLISNNRVKHKRLYLPYSNFLINQSKSVNNFINKRYYQNINSGIIHRSYYNFQDNLKIPQVVTVYDLIYEKFPQYFTSLEEKNFVLNKKQSIKKADAVICISETVKNDVLKHYKIDPNKCFVSYLGVDKMFRQIKNLNLKNNFIKKNNLRNPYILYLGKRAKYKNFINLLQAFVKIKNKSNIDLVCLGSSNFNLEELKFIKKFTLGNRLKIFPYITDKELVMFYNCAQSLIIPSLDEGFGLPILEAFACGIPVILSDIPVFNEIAGPLGIYFNPKNPINIQNAIRYSLNKKYYPISFIKHSQKFSWKETANKTMEVYQALIN